MWRRFAEIARCPECGGPLSLLALEERLVELDPRCFPRAERLGIPAKELGRAVEEGLLLCETCRLWYPVWRGLPVLLPYTTALHRECLRLRPRLFKGLGAQWRPPGRAPVEGELFTLESFSREWDSYAYDGTLWVWSYREREALFLAEMGWAGAPPPAPCGRFLEVGCGLGLVTAFAAKRTRGEAVGVDLSLAAGRASRRFERHPFLHFTQASLWRLPFAPGIFKFAYSHGVLHHTRSTREAFHAVARQVAPGGRLYVWLYGPGSITDSPARRLAYGLESVLRPLLARAPSGVANAALAPLALAYMAVSSWRRFRGNPGRDYTIARALHAARDRFTPLFAHRVAPEALLRWFREEGFVNLHSLRAEEAPPAARDTVRRNTGARGDRPSRAQVREFPSPESER